MADPTPTRDALIDAGLALLREGGPAALTLRRAAARAGVSHAAPAHHFAGLSGLMTAMATRAYDDFAAAMVRARDAAAPDPRARLHGIARGYLDFAHDCAGLFHLIFVMPEPDRDDPALAAASSAAYQVLRDACLPFCEGAPDTAFEVAVWSLVHGYALIGLDDPAGPKARMIAAPDFATLLDRWIDGEIARKALAFPGRAG